MHVPYQQKTVQDIGT